jgi:hypothetical protein
MNFPLPSFAHALARGAGNFVASIGTNFTAGGSGLWDQSALTGQQKGRSLTLQDTQRSHDLITWRKLLAYSRQLFTGYGELRGPLLERALLSNGGLWEPRCVGPNTPKKVRDQYEAYLWEWFKVCDVRMQPYDFWTDMLLASLSLDRDGEPPMLKTKNANGDPRIQFIANHRIYSRTGVQFVPDGRYKGLRMNNGVIYDNVSAPLAYRVLDPSTQFAQALTSQDIPAASLYVTYNPDWCDQGRGMGVISHAIRRGFQVGEIFDSQLVALHRDAKIPVIINNETGSADDGDEHLHGGSGGNDGEDVGDYDLVNAHGDPIIYQDMDDGMFEYFRAGSGSSIEIPSSDRPHPNGRELVEVILRGIHQGIPWPYAFSRSSKESGGADFRGGTIELVNTIVLAHFGRLHRLAHQAATYALAVEIDRKVLPPGECFAVEFSPPPLLTADRWRQYQEDRNNYIIGHDTLQRIAASRGRHWMDDRDQRDIEIDDLFTRAETHAAKHNWLKPREVLEIMEQRSPNPGVQVEPDEEAGAKKSKTAKRKETEE